MPSHALEAPAPPRFPARLTARHGLYAICGFVLVLGLYNVVQSDPGLGYDAKDHIAYADGLVPGGAFPQGVGEYYTPPGFYAVAGFADWMARLAGVSPHAAHRAGEGLNVLFLIGTILLVRRIALELWPGRERIALGAAGFLALLPVAERGASMFHPETMSLFCSTLALFACVRTFRDRRFAWLLGAALGLAQLTRAFSLWTVFVVLVALAAARRVRELGIVLLLAAAIPAPWYAHQALTYDGNPIFPRPATPMAHTKAGAVKPIWARRPWRFYLDPGLPRVFTAPYQPHFSNLAIPTTYTDIWGDYEGVWAWHTPVVSPQSVVTDLQVQAAVGVLPTAMAILGWLAFLVASLRRRLERRAWLAPALLPAVGLLGYLYFTVSYPTPGGDVLKATYLLTTAAVWALGFGWALERLRGRWAIAAGALLAASAVAELPFLVYHAG